MMTFLRKTNKHAVAVGLILLFSPVFAVWMSPSIILVTYPQTLDQIIPVQFGDWVETQSSVAQVGLTTNAEMGDDYPYDQVLTRTYKNSQQQTVMLTIAWGQKQKQEVKIHRPELCYFAQGFEISALKDKDFKMVSLSGKAVIGKEMLAKNPRYTEAVSYWIRIGDTYSENAWQTRWYIFKRGLTGEIPDGVLVRASSIISEISNPDKNFYLNQEFLSDLLTSVDSAEGKALLIR